MKKHEHDPDQISITIMTNISERRAVVIYMPQGNYGGVYVRCLSFYYLVCEAMFDGKTVVGKGIPVLNSKIFQNHAQLESLRAAVRSKDAQDLAMNDPGDLSIEYAIDSKLLAKSHVIHNMVAAWDSMKVSSRYKLANDAWDSLAENLDFAPSHENHKALRGIREFFRIGSEYAEPASENCSVVGNARGSSNIVKRVKEHVVKKGGELPSASEIYSALLVLQGHEMNIRGEGMTVPFSEIVAMRAVRKFASLAVKRRVITEEVEEDLAFLQPLHHCYAIPKWSLVVMSSLLEAMHLILLHRHDPTDHPVSTSVNLNATSESTKSATDGVSVAFMLTRAIDDAFKPPKQNCVTLLESNASCMFLLCNHRDVTHAVVRAVDTCENPIKAKNTLLSTAMCMSPLGLLCEDSILIQHLVDKFFTHLRLMASQTHAFYGEIRGLIFDVYRFDIHGSSSYNVALWGMYEYLFSTLYGYVFPKTWRFSRLPEIFDYRERQVRVYRFMDGLERIIVRNRKFLLRQFEIDSSVATKKALAEKKAASEIKKKNKSKKNKNNNNNKSKVTNEIRQDNLSESGSSDTNNNNSSSEGQEEEDEEQKEQEEEEERNEKDKDSEDADELLNSVSPNFDFIEQKLEVIWNEAIDKYNPNAKIENVAEIQWISPFWKNAMSQDTIK